ncbi:MAG: sulfotransferase [Planctomycetota bacterium]
MPTGVEQLELAAKCDMQTDQRPRTRPKLVLIAGLQKSGTTLLLRLLTDHTSVASSPFSGVEGHDFWGNVPSHAPCEFPAGTIYAGHHGELGHEIPAAAADGHMRRILEQRLAALHVATPVIVNKNPYHTMRLPWLKSVFPDCFIVATVRRAVPNIYSMLKKYVRQDERDRPWREDGWYGVKPRHWRSMLSDDTLLQCTRQWCAVMGKLWADRAHVDLFVGYPELCREPVKTVRRILGAACGEDVAGNVEVPPLVCYDDEYRRGAPLRSKNEEARLQPTANEVIELPPFTDDEIARCQEPCREIESRFAVLRRSGEC